MNLLELNSEAIAYCDRSLLTNQYWEDTTPTIALTKKAKALKALG